MILSVSRRTDIPCYYSEWFMNRIRAGYALTRNPMNHAQLSRVKLTPDIVDCIVFWTKDPTNILPHLDELDERGYNYYFQFTLTPYGRDIEQNLRDKSGIEDTFIALSKRIGTEKIVWRYDPILLAEGIGLEYHKEQFARMCRKFSGYTDTVTISFVDMYSKLKNPPFRVLTDAEMTELAGFIVETARSDGLKAVACCEAIDLTPHGIGHASCIDRARVERIVGAPLGVAADKNQRNGCDCCESIDIGAYNTCLNGCVYCYANNGVSAAKRRHDSHDPKSELLVGSAGENDRITERAVRSNKVGQTSLF